MHVKTVVAAVALAFAAAVVLAAYVTVEQPRGGDLSIPGLSPQEMQSVVGGAAKHCADYHCDGFACKWDDRVSQYVMLVGDGFVGRWCSGSPATCCAVSDYVDCLTFFWNCNSDCSTCANNSKSGTYKTCTSTS